MKALTTSFLLIVFVLAFGHVAADSHKGKHDGDNKMDHMKMTHVLITHEVEDADKWLAAWRGDDGRKAMFAEHGVAGGSQCRRKAGQVRLHSNGRVPTD